MGHEFKPGDLALIVHSRNEENLGRVVTVREWTAAGSRIANECGFTQCTTDCWVVEGEVVTSRLKDPTEKFVVSRHAFKARSLMPLKGDEEPAQVRQAERVS